jgi:cell division protein FtsL
MSVAMKIGVAVMSLTLGVSAIAVVSTKHEARSLFIQLQGLNGERDALEIEWGQLNSNRAPGQRTVASSRPRASDCAW